MPFLEFLLLLAVAGASFVNAQEQTPLCSTPSLEVASVVENIAMRLLVPEPNTTASTMEEPQPTIAEDSETSESIPAPTSVRVVTRTTVPIVPATFTPYAIPEERPIPGAFPAVHPKNPPPVGSRAIPNFGAAWDEAYRKAKSRISKYSLADKVNITTGVGWQGGRCVGNIPPVPFTSSLNPEVSDSQFPGLCLQDSPTGVRLTDYASVFPNGINAAASWNRRLIRERGLLMGREFKGKGVHVALGPMMNMGRIPQGGRNWEGFGADPFLTGEAAYETVLGLQAGGTQACAKHLVANEQEYKRKMSSSETDDRTEHEIYLHPFLRSIMAGTTSIMCSYNLINGTYACENSRIMNEVVREEFGFQGYILSDWQAQHSTMSAMTGLDMSMPGDVVFNSNTSYWRETLVTFVENGTIPESRIDDMATRILAGWYLLKQDSPSFPQVSFDSFRAEDESLNDHIDVQADHDKHIRKLGAASIVVLKNEKHALPLGKHHSANKEAERSIFIAGSNAGPGGVGHNAFPDHKGLDGHLAIGWGSGTAWFTYLVTPLEAIGIRARQDHTSVTYLLDDYDLERAGDLAKQKDVALVFIASNSGEGTMGDRQNLTAWHGGEDLLLAVAAHNENTVVVVNTVGPMLVESWIDHPNVTAVVWAGVLGTESGNAIKDVLYGDWNPSGRLPYTIGKQPEDYGPAQLILGGEPDDIIAIPYTEGLNIDYRGFDARNITPRFEFGFGLSYTTFEYSELTIQEIHEDLPEDRELIHAWERGEATPHLPGISRAFWLHQPIYEVAFVVENTGRVFGGDIPQLYLNFPESAGEPPSILKGFDNVELEPVEAKQVKITLSRYDLSIWDVEKQGWRKPAGEIGVTISRSSRDPKLKSTIPLRRVYQDEL